MHRLPWPVWYSVNCDHLRIAHCRSVFVVRKWYSFDKSAMPNRLADVVRLASLCSIHVTVDDIIAIIWITVGCGSQWTGAPNSLSLFNKADIGLFVILCRPLDKSNPMFWLVIHTLVNLFLCRLWFRARAIWFDKTRVEFFGHNYLNSGKSF